MAPWQNHASGAPSFARFLRRWVALGWHHGTFVFTPREFQMKCSGSIATRPCKERKDGAPG